MSYISEVKLKAAYRVALCLKEYLREYPANRLRPIGAPGSFARAEQEMLIRLEDDARDAIKDWADSE